MLKINLKEVMTLFPWLIISLIASYVLTVRYFPIEPDAANSPLVWRAFATNGFSAFRDWVPTPDNWYLTTYPINFLFFLLTGNDGKLSLILSTSLFISITSFILASLVYSINKSYNALFILLSLTLFPAHVYIFGYAAHPFSHYSTNCFGALVLALSYMNIRRNSVSLTMIICFISTLASVSDPWFQVTYFLPLLISHFYFSKKKIVHKKSTAILLVGFILSLSNLSILQRILGLPIQRFRLVPVDQWLNNAVQIVHMLGSSLNIFFTDNHVTSGASFLIWMVLFIYSLLVCIRKGNYCLFISLFSFLSVLGIISSFIVSHEFPEGASNARFFTNAICFIVAQTALGLTFTKKPLAFIIFPLYITSSIYSYSQYTTSPLNEEKQTLDYIRYLEKNNLNFGYSDYWQMANSVNWLSNGKIHITSIMYDDEKNRIELDRSRPQTMQSWLSESWLKKSPERQFLLLPWKSTVTSTAIQTEAVKKEIGEPDQILSYKGFSIFIYNHRILPN